MSPAWGPPRGGSSRKEPCASRVHPLRRRSAFRRERKRPVPSVGRLALMSTPHPSRLAGPEASCPCRLGSRQPPAQRCPPAKQREREREISEGLLPLGLASRNPWVTWTVPLGTEGPTRSGALEEEGAAAVSAGTISSRRSAKTLPRCLPLTGPHPAPSPLNSASAFTAHLYMLIIINLAALTQRQCLLL